MVLLAPIDVDDEDGNDLRRVEYDILKAVVCNVGIGSSEGGGLGPQPVFAPYLGVAAHCYRAHHQLQTSVFSRSRGPALASQI